MTAYTSIREISKEVPIMTEMLITIFNNLFKATLDVFLGLTVGTVLLLQTPVVLVLLKSLWHFGIDHLL